MLRLLDTFSGIGGFSLAARWLGGFETVQFVEREPYCQRILSKHWPNVPIHDDICTFNPEPGSADVIVGGFPCQDISTAGKRAGIKQGTRSGLFYELMRVVRVVRPRFIVLENVAAIVSDGLDTVLGELAEAGFDAEWACIKASDVGACHRRDRWWLVAYSSSADRRQVDDQEWQRNGDASDNCGAVTAHSSHMLCNGCASEQPRQPSGRPIPEPRDRHGADAANSNYARLEGRQSAGLSERGQQWAFGPGDSRCRQLSPDWRAYVSEPVLCRGNDGLSGRVDRLKALGNAVVPQVAMIPLAKVLELAARA